jgi:hypothetical protein
MPSHLMHHLHNHLHLCIITGSQEESVVAEPEAVEEVPQVEPAQEVQAEEDVVDELQECPDHRPSSFERGKPWSILSLLFYKSNLLYMSFIYCCIKLYELSETVNAFITILAYTYYIITLLGLESNNCLALFRPIAIGDFLSSAIIGGY